MKLDPATWRQLSGLLDDALDLAPADVPAWLARLPPEHAALAPMLREMLVRRAAPETQDLIDRPPPITLAEGAFADHELAAGQAIGPYRLVRRIGTGGMGVVWLAERSDGLVKRPLALKLPHFAVSHGALAERFARERDILATLEHPSIARLYDAGFAADGRPYLALEYVEGSPITRACDERALDLRARLALFRKVVLTVHFAHAHLVLHRDLKPSNIMVTAQGEPKLLDFGIAKLMQDGTAQETELTQRAGGALTPDYASPEQIAGRPLTTASDVYSLGVVLYELVAGERPYRLKRGTRAELEEAILTQEVERASVRAGDEIAARQGTSRARYRRSLAGDVDTILDKALRKAPQARYASAGALADDLGRLLEGQPILAQAPSTGYRLRKFVARNRVATVAGALVVAALGAGSAIALWQASEAREQAARSNALAEFVIGVFNQNSAAQKDPAQARKTSARELLDLGKVRLLNGKDTNPAVADRLLDTFSELYYQLGLPAETIALDEARVRNAEAAFGPRDLRTLDAQRNLASIYMSTGRMDDARKLADQVLSVLDAQGAKGTALRGKVLGTLSQTYLASDPERSYRYLREEVDVLRSCCRSDPELPLALANLALAQAIRGEVRAAGATIDQAGKAHDALPDGGGKHGRAYIYGFATSILTNLDKPAEAEQSARDGLATSLAASGARNSWTYVEQNRLASFLLGASKSDEGRRIALATLADAQAAPDVLGHVTLRARALVARSGVDDDALAQMPPLRASLDQPIDPFTRFEVLYALLQHDLARDEPQRAAALCPALRALVATGPFPRSAGPAGPIALCVAALARSGQLAAARALLDGETRRLDGLEVVPLAARVNIGVAAGELLVRENRGAEAIALGESLRAEIAGRADRAYFADHDARLARVIPPR